MIEKKENNQKMNVKILKEMKKKCLHPTKKRFKIELKRIKNKQ